MNTTETQQWFYLLISTIAGIAVFGLFYVLAVFFIPPAEDVRDYYAGVVHFTQESLPPQNRVRVVVPPPGEIYKDFYGLKRNEPMRIDHYRVIYRGLEGSGRFKLEMANTKLDPKSFYTLTFQPETPSGTIRIGNQIFSVLSARTSILHLRRITE